MDRLVALASFGMLRSPSNPEVAGFFATAREILMRLRTRNGFVDAALAMGDDTYYPTAHPDPEIWGERRYPVISDGRFEEGSIPILTLSVWEAIDDVRTFSYSDLHGDALKRRREWFQKIQGHTYAIWRFSRPQWPTFKEATQRILSLRTNGSGPETFDFAFVADHDA
jgi:hypothetical protein